MCRTLLSDRESALHQILSQSATHQIGCAWKILTTQEVTVECLFLRSGHPTPKHQECPCCLHSCCHTHTNAMAEDIELSVLKHKVEKWSHVDCGQAKVLQARRKADSYPEHRPAWHQFARLENRFDFFLLLPQPRTHMISCSFLYKISNLYRLSSMTVTLLRVRGTISLDRPVSTTLYFI
jgi:hypothetical protein